MKNLKLSILIVALVAITATSCKKMEEVYSCNPTTNEWVKENLSPIQKMNRQDLLELDFEKRIPAYRAFTLDQKYECWVDKFEQIKSLKWTEKELNHISLLAKSIEKEWFDRNINKNEVDDFLMNWVLDGVSLFGWSKYEVGCMLSCLYDVDIDDDNIVFKAPTGGIGTGITVSLDCSCSTAAWNDFCPWGGHSCSSDVGCNEIPHYCGWFLRKDCVGRCRP